MPFELTTRTNTSELRRSQPEILRPSWLEGGRETLASKVQRRPLEKKCLGKEGEKEGEKERGGSVAPTERPIERVSEDLSSPARSVVE